MVSLLYSDSFARPKWPPWSGLAIFCAFLCMFESKPDPLCFALWQSKGVRPNVDTLGCMVEAFARRQELKPALYLLEVRGRGNLDQLFIRLRDRRVMYDHPFRGS
jgi:hypothetical protein